MMPYCPSCQTRVDPTLTGDTCPDCGWKFHTGTAPGSLLVKPAARPKIPVEVELSITDDRTGSSERFQIGIPKTVETILTQVSAKARRVKCWLQTHGDLDDGQAMILHTDGGTPEQAIEDIKKVTYGGGGDPSEHHLDAIEALMRTVPWTADPTRARGAILAFTTSDTKPTKSGLTARKLGEEIKARGLLLYLVCEPTPTLVELVDAAGGLLFEISNDPDAQVLQQIAAQLAASIVATLSSGATVPMAAPAVA